MSETAVVYTECGRAKQWAKPACKRITKITFRFLGIVEMNQALVREWVSRRERERETSVQSPFCQAFVNSCICLKVSHAIFLYFRAQTVTWKIMCTHPKNKHKWTQYRYHSLSSARSLIHGLSFSVFSFSDAIWSFFGSAFKVWKFNRKKSPRHFEGMFTLFFSLFLTAGPYDLLAIFQGPDLLSACRQRKPSFGIKKLMWEITKHTQW